MNYSKETHELIERMCRNVERASFKLDKKKAKEAILNTYDLFDLPRPKKVVWFDSPLEKDFEDNSSYAWSAWSAWSTRSAWSAWSAWSAGSAGSARSARSAWSAGSASWTGLDYDFDWYVIEHEYIKNRKDNPGDEPNEHDEKYLAYSELLMEAKEAGLGYRVELDDVLYLAPTPIVKIDEQNRFHSEKEPAIKWKGSETYMLHGVKFEKEWWYKIVNDKLSPEEILAIDNIEHRRIAWEYMNKKKLEGLKDFKVLDEIKDDGKGYPMRVIQFNHPDAGEIRYYNCFCPSTGREYYLGTEETICVKAKSKSFGFDEVEFINEW